jgi:hypothetical protein
VVILFPCAVSVFVFMDTGLWARHKSFHTGTGGRLKGYHLIYIKDMTIFLFSTVVSDTFVGHIQSCQMSSELSFSG